MSRYRFAVLGAALALGMSGLHGWSDSAPADRIDQRLNEKFGARLREAIQLLEGRATDLQFRIRGPKQPHPDILVAVVDEKSVQKYGIWPWPRTLIAKAITRLHHAEVKSVGLDMIFTDQVRNETLIAHREVAKRLEELSVREPRFVKFLIQWNRQAPSSPDQALTDALRNAPEVVQGVVAYTSQDASSFSRLAAEEERTLLPQILTQLSGRMPFTFFPEVDLQKVLSWKMYSAQTPLEQFAGINARLGHLNTSPDADGTIRRMPLFAQLERPKGLLPSLALQIAATYFDAEIEAVYDPELHKISGARLRRNRGGEVWVPMETSEPYILINHLGPQAAFPTISLSDVIDGNFSPEQFRGKAVLIGVTLVGNFDQRVTPFAKIEPGVFIQASLLSNILSADYLQRPITFRLLEWFFMLMSAIILAYVVPRSHFAFKLLAMCLIGIFYLVLDQVLFIHGYKLATVMPMMNLFVCSFVLLFASYLTVDREKLHLRSAFQHYLNQSVMDQMLRDPERLKLGGEKKEMTVLFSDIRGFTSLSEKMTPEALVKFINGYLTPMTQIVFEQGGTLDKYIGDALMAFWGAPIDQPDHAVRACHAALRFNEKLSELKAVWKSEHLPEVDIGVGINSGSMIVGNMGSHLRFDYTVMGDAVNLASRLEGLNKEYGTRLLISESTYRLAQTTMLARRLGAVRVKGKKEPVGLYELRGIRSDSKADSVELQTIELFERAVSAYASRQFVEAEAGFSQVLQVWPADPPAQRYLLQILGFKDHPPSAEWDGIYTATSK